jgi:hypothetical protein
MSAFDTDGLIGETFSFTHSVRDQPAKLPVLLFLGLGVATGNLFWTKLK